MDLRDYFKKKKRPIIEIDLTGDDREPSSIPYQYQWSIYQKLTVALKWNQIRLQRDPKNRRIFLRMSLLFLLLFLKGYCLILVRHIPSQMSSLSQWRLAFPVYRGQITSMFKGKKAEIHFIMSPTSGIDSELGLISFVKTSFIPNKNDALYDVGAMEITFVSNKKPTFYHIVVEFMILPLSTLYSLYTGKRRETLKSKTI